MEQFTEKYLLRRAAGLFWLIDTSADGDYKPPVPLNEVGAAIWTRLSEGGTEEEICGWLGEEYGISPEQAREDLDGFKAQLQSRGIIFGGAR